MYCYILLVKEPLNINKNIYFGFVISKFEILVTQTLTVLKAARKFNQAWHHPVSGAKNTLIVTHLQRCKTHPITNAECPGSVEYSLIAITPKFSLPLRGGIC